MALATTCPQCKTSFRVVPDQLKLRRGFVRCGRCRHVFAGIDHLRYVDDAQLRAAEAAARKRALAPQDERVHGEGRVHDEAHEHEHEYGEALGHGEAVELEHGDPRERGDEPGLVPAHERERDDGHEHGEALGPATERAAAPPSPVDPNAAPEAADEAAGAAARGWTVTDAEASAPDREAADAGTAHSEAAPDEDVEFVVVGTPDFAPLPGQAPDDDPTLLDGGREDARVASPADASSWQDPFPGRFVAADAAARSPASPAPPASADPWSADGRDAAFARTGEGLAAEDDEGESAIDYFSTRRSRGFADRGRLAAGALAFALSLTLAAQWIVAERAVLAARVPALAPALTAALAPFGLRVGAPRTLDALTIESFELQASALPDVLEMRALLRNRADHPVRWPSMQLTLTDRSSQVLVSRRLDPDEYLLEADADAEDGIPPHTEWPLRLALETRELQLAGYDYRVRLFYP